MRGIALLPGPFSISFEGAKVDILGRRGKNKEEFSKKEGKLGEKHILRFQNFI